MSDDKTISSDIGQILPDIVRCPAVILRPAHNYTNNERDLIRRTVKVTEEKNAGNTERVYRVRGDPKKWSSIGLLSKEMAINKYLQR